jgi:hypothetical protein
VVVHNLDIVSVAPAKADAVLIVDPNAVLSDPLSLQGFEPVAWTGKQIAQSSRDVQGVQSPARGGFDIYETGNPFPSAEQPFGIRAVERLDHGSHYTSRFTESVKFYG